MSEGMQTVLLVDDEEFFLRSMVDGFAAHRGKVQLLTAANGKAALPYPLQKWRNLTTRPRRA